MRDIVMRLRAVLAGFVDMTPDDVATTAQQVADELLRERKRREEAERERDEWKAANDLSVQRWQRADADNAALLERMRALEAACTESVRLLETEWPEDAGHRVADLLRAAMKPETE